MQWQPSRFRRRFLAAGAALGAGAALRLPAAIAQTYPARAVRLLVPFVAGGGPDVVCRFVADRMSRALGQPMVIENRPGANGMLGLQVVRQAAPDGYTLLYLSSAQVSVQAMSRSADILRDFALIGRMSDTPSVLVVPPKLPPANLIELIAYLKKNPGKLNYGTGGVGSPSHFATGMLHSIAGPFDSVPIHYKGAPEIGHALAQGDIHFTITIVPPLLPLIRQGRVRALAVTASERLAALPEVPTMAEAGLPAYRFHSWGGIAAPAGTPPKIVELLHREMNRVLASAETAAFADAIASRAVPSESPAAFVAFVREELMRLEKLVKDFNIRPEQGS